MPLVLAIILLAVFGPDAKAQGPKGGFHFIHESLRGTFKALPMGQERLQMTYEIMGVMIGDTPEDLLHNASLRCVGAFHAVNGEYTDDSGFCVATRPDGDKIFATYKTVGKIGRGPRGLLPSSVAQGNWSAYRVTSNLRELLCGLLPKERSSAIPEKGPV